jgi:hypothetical protein
MIAVVNSSQVAIIPQTINTGNTGRSYKDALASPKPKQPTETILSVKQIQEMLNIVFHLMPEHLKKNIVLLKAEQYLERMFQSASFVYFSEVISCYRDMFTLASTIADHIEKLRYDDAKVALKEQINAVRFGNIAFIPGGTSYHAVIYVIKGNPQGTCELSLFNTGAGCRLSSIEGHSQVTTFFNLDLNALLTDQFLDIILTPYKESYAVPSIPESFSNKLLRTMYWFLQQYLKKEPKYLIHSALQHHGTCAASSIEAGIRAYGSKEAVRQLDMPLMDNLLSRLEAINRYTLKLAPGESKELLATIKKIQVALVPRKFERRVLAPHSLNKLTMFSKVSDCERENNGSTHSMTASK